MGVVPGENGEWAWYLLRRKGGAVPGEEDKGAWYLVRDKGAWYPVSRVRRLGAW